MKNARFLASQQDLPQASLQSMCLSIEHIFSIVLDGELRELRNLLSQKPLQGYVLSVSRLPPALLVTELPDDISEEHLELYFEYEKYGGGTVTDVQLYAQQRCAVITFAEEASKLSRCQEN